MTLNPGRLRGQGSRLSNDGCWRVGNLARNKPLCWEMMERDMGDTPARLKQELAALGEDDLGQRDLWLFAPLLVVAAALPLAIVAVLSASLYFAAHSADRYGGASFASRFENVYTR